VTEKILAQAVEKFASVTHGLSNATLDREWKWRAYDEGVRFAFFRTYEELCQLATRAAATRAEQGPAITIAQRALAQYHAAFRDLQAILLGVGDADFDTPPAEGEWPLRTILGHTMAAERGFFAITWYAVEQGRKGNPPIKMPDDKVEAFVGSWDAFEHKMDESLAGILAHYEALRQRILHELADIGEDELNIPSLWWEGEPMPIQFRLHRFDSHLRQHTIQAEKTLDALGYQPNEAKRLLRIIYRALAEAEGGAIGAWDVGAEQRRAIAAGIAARADEITSVATRQPITHQPITQKL